MSFLPVHARYLAPPPLESHFQIWEIFPKFQGSQNPRQGRKNMRISDDRYSRDRLRLDLALRFIHHEARTHTIRAWTGLTDDRIRKLYRTYLYEAGGASVARHRGKSPRQAAFFTRSLRMRREAAVFASVSSLFGLITRDSITVDRAAPPAPTVARGALLCEAFETYRALVGEPQISFEHAVFLLGALHVGDELRVALCRDCAGVLVTDRLALRTPVCNDCAGVRGVATETATAP
jgi:hypothetical protein